jgi:dolichyldiphosphatase
VSKLIADVLLDGTSFIVTALAGGAVLYFHDGKSMLLVVGALISRTIVISLKKIIKQPRPDPTKKKSEGFPSRFFSFGSVVPGSFFFFFTSCRSSHATLLSYFAFALSHARWSDSPLWRLFLAVACFVLVAVRVVHGYHSVGQVAAGLVLGVSLSATWNWISDAFLMTHANAFAAAAWELVMRNTSNP